MNFNRIYEDEQKNQQNNTQGNQQDSNAQANKIDPQSLTEIAKSLEERVNDLKKIYQGLVNQEKQLQNAEKWRLESAKNNKFQQKINNASIYTQATIANAANNIKNTVANNVAALKGNLNNKQQSNLNAQQVQQIYDENNTPEKKLIETIALFKKSYESMVKIYDKSFKKNIEEYIKNNVGKDNSKQDNSSNQKNDSEALQNVQKDNKGGEQQPQQEATPQSENQK